jgi:ABC-type branched-subunit amino acid transport system substrate-binding protein
MEHAQHHLSPNKEQRLMTRRSRLWRLLAVLGVLALLAAACGDDDDDSEGAQDDTTETTEEGGDRAGALEGMRGTTPLPAELPEEFRTRIQEVDPEVEDINYAAESYDAVVIITLAAQIAGSDGIELASEINGVTRDGEKCTEYAQCLELVQAGTDIDYDGVSGPLEFAGNGEPTLGTYGLLEFGSDNRLLEDPENQSAEFTPEEVEAIPETPPEGTRAGDGVLKIGTLLPETGTLSFLGPPMIAASKLGVQEVNENGGYGGQDVALTEGDSGDTSTDTANSTVDRELSENVDAIIGAASSAVTLTVIDKVVNAGVVLFSPANTSAALSDYPDKGLYFRDAPPDALQGEVLAGMIADDGHSTLALMVLNDPYGTGLADAVEENFTASGGEVVERIEYDPQASTFDAEVQRLADADPDAIALITFEEGSRILATMVEQGIGPRDLSIYGVDGNMGNALGEDFDAGE